MRLSVSFYDGAGLPVGVEIVEVEAPPGTVFARAAADSLPLWASEQAIVPHEAQPREGYPIFDATTREVEPGDDRTWPLMSTCGCGQSVIQLRADALWRHCG